METKEKFDGFVREASYHQTSHALLPIKFASRFLIHLLFLATTHCSMASAPKAGFSLPDNVQEVTFKFRKFKNLILLPVIINDTVVVNLILDTGCRNLLLFGGVFEKLFVV